MGRASRSLVVGIALVSVACLVGLLWGERFLDRSAPAAVTSRAAPQESVDLLGPPADASAESSRTPERGPTPVEPGSGRVLFVDLGRSMATAGTRWRFAAAGEDARGSVQRALGADGSCSLPDGSWHVEPLDRGWSVRTSRVHVRAEAPSTVWVARTSALEVVVTNASGRPVEGARVRWLPRRTEGEEEPWPGWLPTVAAETTTDPGGIARLELRAAAGELAVLAEGHRAERRWLSGARERRIEIRLLPAGEGAGASVRLEDPEGRPLAGVRMRTTLGPVPAVSDARGLLSLPAWVPDETVSLEGESILPVELPVRELAAREVAVLSLPSRVRLVVRGPDGESGGVRGEVHAFVEIAAVEGRLGSPLVPPALAFSGGEHELVLPRDAETRIDLASGGASASVVVTPRSAEETVEALLGESEELLALELGGLAGDARGRAVARYGYRRDVAEVIHGPSTVLFPWPDEIDRIDVLVEGHVPLRLRPIRTEPHRSGTVHLRPEPGHDVPMRVRDTTGRPVGGVVVELEEGPHTGRQGTFLEDALCWATSHPGWCEGEHLGLRGITDAEGSTLLEDARLGSYFVFIHPPAGAYGADDLTSDPWSIGPQAWTVTGAGRLEVRIPSAAWCHVEAFDARTGAPLGQVLLSSPGELGTLKMPGHVWEGWLPDTWSPLVVGSPGFAPAGIEDPAAREAWSVHLEPREPLVLLIEGDAEGLEGRTLPVEALRQGPAWLSPVWACTTERLEDGRATFHLPVREDVLLRVPELEAQGVVWSFEPELVPLAGGSATFRARRREP